LAKAYKSARIMADLGQQDLANGAGVSRRTIENFEQGRTTPNPATIRAIDGHLIEYGVVVVFDPYGFPAGIVQSAEYAAQKLTARQVRGMFIHSHFRDANPEQIKKLTNDGII